MARRLTRLILGGALLIASSLQACGSNAGRPIGDLPGGEEEEPEATGGAIVAPPAGAGSHAGGAGGGGAAD